jgi:glycosyltransferase 2 family protein
MAGSLASAGAHANFARVSEAVPELTSSTSFLRRVGPVLLLAVLVFAVFSAVSDVRALGVSLATFHWPSLGIALLLVSGNYLLRFLRWQFYLRTLQVEVPLRLSALVFVSGFVMSVTPGKMGEVWKSVLLHEYRGIGIARTASIVVAERLLDLVALVVLVSLGSAAFPAGRAIAAAGFVVVAVIVLGCTVRPLGYFALEVLGRLPRAAALSSKLRETYDALHALTRPLPFFVSGCYALVGWALECAATWVLVSGFSGSVIGWDGATFGYAAGTLAGALAMLPGGRSSACPKRFVRQPP